MKLSQPEGWSLGNAQTGDEFAPAPAFYVMALHEDEHEHVPAKSHDYLPDANFPGASAWAFGNCYSVTDFGGTRNVEFRANNGGTIKGRAIEKLNWKMSVDNPAASNQFKPGAGYWIALYDASKFNRDSAIRAAHGHEEPADEAAA